MFSITTADNTKVEVECIACAIAKKEVEVIGGTIAETRHFNVSNDFEYPIPGFLIIGSNRHVRSVADFDAEESVEFVTFLANIRKAMRTIGIEKVTMVQEERTEDSHFHLWLFPWYEWMEEIGKGVSSIRKIMEFAGANNKTEPVFERIRSDCEKLRAILAAR